MTVMFMALLVVYPVAQGHAYWEVDLGFIGLDGTIGVGVTRRWMWMVRQLCFPLGTTSLYFLLISFAVEIVEDFVINYVVRRHTKAKGS